MSMIFNHFSFLYDPFMKLFKLDDNTKIIEVINSFATPYKILDVGGGSGLLASQLIEFNHNVTIIDSSQRMLDLALKRNDKIRTINAKIEILDNKEKYDLIILKDCLHHLKDQEASLKILVFLLNENGKLIIQDFNPDNVQTKLIFLFERMCFEKIKPISISTINELVKSDLKGENIIINKRDYLFVGEKL